MIQTFVRSIICSFTIFLIRKITPPPPHPLTSGKHGKECEEMFLS